MAQKPETRFRNASVNPFIKRLKNTWAATIQQQSICGTPDKLLCVRGRFVGLELKARGGRLTKLQEYNLNLIEKAGGVAIVADPDNWESVKVQLLKLDQGEDDGRK